MSKAEDLLARMREGISRLLEEAAARNATTLDGIHMRALEAEGPIDAPHPDERWRFRSRKVFERLREHGMAFSAPWHHREIWFWAASTSEGVDWIEREVRYWESRVEKHVRQMELRKKKGDLPRLEYVYVEGDEFRFAGDEE